MSEHLNKIFIKRWDALDTFLTRGFLWASIAASAIAFALGEVTHGLLLLFAILAYWVGRWDGRKRLYEQLARLSLTEPSNTAK